MKRIYACIAIVGVLLSVAFYSSWKVQSFADVISADLDTAAEAIRNADYPAARQALADGADRCNQMRTKIEPPAAHSRFYRAGSCAAGGGRTPGNGCPRGSLW